MEADVQLCENTENYCSIVDASETLRIVRVGDYDNCACIGAHVKNTSEIGTFRILTHDFADGRWRMRFKLENCPYVEE